MKKYKVSIVGASGYTGFELVKILLRHPQAEIVHLAVREGIDAPYSNLFPALRGRCDLSCSAIDADRLCGGSEVIFFGLPHKSSMEIIPDFIRPGIKIIDLSADFRLNSAAVYRLAYGSEHRHPEMLSCFVYGLAEFNRHLVRSTETVANPGCFPTGIELALWPVLQKNLIDQQTIIVDSKTGISGGGKTPKPEFHFPDCNENFSAYKVASHQHEPEIEQELCKMAGSPVDILFVPHLAPMTRGIFNTIYARMREPLSQSEVQDLYEEFYRREPFVRILEPGRSPQTAQVSGSNFCDIGLKVHGANLILMSAIDNLIKGASGQAVQNMNIMLGLEETTALI